HIPVQVVDGAGFGKWFGRGTPGGEHVGFGVVTIPGAAAVGGAHRHLPGALRIAEDIVVVDEVRVLVIDRERVEVLHQVPVGVFPESARIGPGAELVLAPIDHGMVQVPGGAWRCVAVDDGRRLGDGVGAARRAATGGHGGNRYSGSEQGSAADHGGSPDVWHEGYRALTGFRAS